MFAKEHEINHEVINIRKDGYVEKGIYHIQHVNHYHSDLKEWLKRFDGVTLATWITTIRSFKQA